ncbi:MAG TPA: hypothetical protein VHM70_30490 [Polyangiaceae bacterium]|jgi:hypothetical protein|nr:hypothetical protein [Polyangiaceae bacterium]
MHRTRKHFEIVGHSPEDLESRLRVLLRALSAAHAQVSSVVRHAARYGQVRALVRYRFPDDQLAKRADSGTRASNGGCRALLPR